MKKTDLMTIKEWMESEGVLGYDDGAFIMDEEEFEDSFRHNNEGDLSKEDYARQICKESLLKAGIPEEMVNMGIDYENEESNNKFNAWLSDQGEMI